VGPMCISGQWWIQEIEKRMQIVTGSGTAVPAVGSRGEVP